MRILYFILASGLLAGCTGASQDVSGRADDLSTEEQRFAQFIQSENHASDVYDSEDDLIVAGKRLRASTDLYLQPDHRFTLYYRSPSWTPHLAEPREPSAS